MSPSPDTPDFTTPPAPSEPVRIFLNGVPLDAERGETVLDAISRWDGALAAQLRDGARALADNRGLVTGLDTVVYGGAIFRVVSNRPGNHHAGLGGDTEQQFDPADDPLTDDPVPDDPLADRGE